MQTPVPGIIVGGKYRILHALGEGGMGAVFEVEHVLTLKRAAIKWLHPQLLSPEASQSRLLQEARATSRIRHRNVVDLYDVVEEDGALFLVMELLAGELLSSWLSEDGHTFGELIALLLPAMEGIAAAHAAGVVHRDIKPGNIFLARAGTLGERVPKVIDFGISRTFDGERLTRSGMAMGTPRYVSFEQLRGERDVDGRSDVYAFGVMLYEALLGQAPHEARSFAEQAIRFVTTVPITPRALRPELPMALEAVIVRAIARDRDDRFQSMRELIEALAPFASATSTYAKLPLWREREGMAAAPTLGAPGHAGVRAHAYGGATTPVTGSAAHSVHAQPRWVRYGVRAVVMLSVGLLAHAVRVQGAPGAHAPLSMPGLEAGMAVHPASASQRHEADASGPLPAATLTQAHASSLRAHTETEAATAGEAAGLADVPVRPPEAEPLRATTPYLHRQIGRARAALQTAASERARDAGADPGLASEPAGLGSRAEPDAVAPRAGHVLRHEF